MELGMERVEIGRSPQRRLRPRSLCWIRDQWRTGVDRNRLTRPGERPPLRRAESALKRHFSRVPVVHPRPATHRGDRHRAGHRWRSLPQFAANPPHRGANRQTGSCVCPPPQRPPHRRGCKRSCRTWEPGRSRRWDGLRGGLGADRIVFRRRSCRRAGRFATCWHRWCKPRWYAGRSHPRRPDTRHLTARYLTVILPVILLVMEPVTKVVGTPQSEPRRSGT